MTLRQRALAYGVTQSCSRKAREAQSSEKTVNGARQVGDYGAHLNSCVVKLVKYSSFCLKACRMPVSSFCRFTKACATRQPHVRTCIHVYSRNPCENIKDAAALRAAAHSHEAVFLPGRAPEPAAEHAKAYSFPWLLPGHAGILRGQKLAAGIRAHNPTHLGVLVLGLEGLKLLLLLHAPLSLAHLQQRSSMDKNGGPLNINPMYEPIRICKAGTKRDARCT